MLESDKGDSINVLFSLLYQEYIGGKDERYRFLMVFHGQPMYRFAHQYY